MDFIKEKMIPRKDLLFFLTFPLVLWLAMFPEFSITSQCVRIMDADGNEIEYQMDDKELAKAVLEADGDEIVIKSRLLEMILEWNEK